MTYSTVQARPVGQVDTAHAADPMLTIRSLVKTYEQSDPGTRPAIDDVSLDVQPGEFFTLLGPSGCGKTTTLRSVAGLETPTSGTISIDGEPVFSPRGVVPVHKRDIAMVFQSYAIWPHMSVWENVAFPLAQQKLPKEELRERTADALDMVSLGHLAERPATALSGGQQQRVAFARALVRRSKLVLLDEPLSNLDAALRVAMRAELREIQQTLGTTTIYVTHDQDEALALSDRVAVMRNGKVLEVGTPHELYLRPKHEFTASFIGQAQLWPLTRTADEGVIESPFGPLRVDTRSLEGDLKLLVRPERIQIADPNSTTLVNSFDGTITDVVFSGKLTDLEVETSAGKLRVQELSGRSRCPGDRVRLVMPRQDCVAVASE